MAEVRHAPDRSRFEIWVDDRRAGFVDYRDGADGTRLFPHTVVEPAFEGRGLASQMVRTALDATREEGRTVVATCWFVDGWIDRHPSYADLRA